MKVSISVLRSYLREELQGMQPQKMSFEELLSMQDKLDNMVASGRMLMRDYEARWSDVLAAAGWTHDQYASELDRRWDYIDSERALPVKRHAVN